MRIGKMEAQFLVTFPKPEDLFTSAINFHEKIMKSLNDTLGSSGICFQVLLCRKKV